MKKQITAITGLLLCIAATAQVTVSGALRQTIFNADSVYWFSDISKAKIDISAEHSTLEIKQFDWETQTFQQVLKKDSSSETETFQPASEGAFLIEITRDETTITKRFWCVAPKNDAVDFVIDSVTCQGLYARASAEAEPIKYFDFEKNETREQQQVLTYQWSMCDSVVLTTFQPEATLPTPIEDGELRLVVQNQSFAQAVKTDSVESYGVRAAYSAEIRSRSVPNELDGAEFHSAPVEVELKNLSKGQIDVSEWALGGSARLFDRNPVYSFQQSGEYRIALTVTNEATGCQSTDSTTVVKVTDSALEFPDVFTPNGDGVNDEFRPAYKSLKTYKLTIFNRWGRKIYETTDPATGWDGKINSSNAAAGTYFFVAEAEGFDRNVLLRRKGNVTLLRGEN